MRLRLLPFLLALALAACDSTQTFEPSAYVGTYTGTNTLTEPDGFSLTEAVTASVEVDPAAGTMMIIRQVEGEPEDVLTGTYDENGVRFVSETSSASYQFEIAASGDIRGDGAIAYQDTEADITFSGRITDGTFDLTTITTITASPSPDRVGWATTNTMRTSRR